MKRFQLGIAAQKSSRARTHAALNPNPNPKPKPSPRSGSDHNKPISLRSSRGSRGMHWPWLVGSHPENLLMMGLPRPQRSRVKVTCAGTFPHNVGRVKVVTVVPSAAILATDMQSRALLPLTSPWPSTDPSSLVVPVQPISVAGIAQPIQRASPQRVDLPRPFLLGAVVRTEATPGDGQCDIMKSHLFGLTSENR